MNVFVFEQLSSHEKVTFGDVSRYWMALGLQRQKLDDLLELVTMPTPSSDRNADNDSFDDWNKLLALAAGQLGHVCAQADRHPLSPLQNIPSTHTIKEEKEKENSLARVNLT